MSAGHLAGVVVLATKVAIIAGFEPFGGSEKNPSGDAIAHLERYAGTLATHPLVLPVCCESAWEMLETAVNNLPKDAKFAVVLAGLASTRRHMEVERFALNCRQYRIPDNGNHKWDGEEVLAGQPAAIRSAAVDKLLLARLDESGLAAKISDHAGTFVCNEIYYRALHAWQAEPRCLGVVFTHVPPIDVYADRSVPGTSVSDADGVYPIDRYAEALSLIACHLLKE